MAKSCSIFEENLICDHFGETINHNYYSYYKKVMGYTENYKCNHLDLVYDGYTCNSRYLSKNKIIIYDFTKYNKLEDIKFNRKSTSERGDLSQFIRYTQEFLDDYYNKIRNILPK